MLYSFIYILLGILHPLHISVTEIRYDEKEKELEIITRIFTDDLETAIRAYRAMPELDLLNPVGGVTTKELVSEYLLKHIKISLDGKPQRIEYLGMEQEPDALVCYIRVDNVKKWKTITVVNEVIVAAYSDQSNLVHVTAHGKVRSLRLMKNNSSGTLTFDSK